MQISFAHDVTVNLDLTIQHQALLFLRVAMRGYDCSGLQAQHDSLPVRLAIAAHDPELDQFREPLPLALVGTQRAGPRRRLDDSALHHAAPQLVPLRSTELGRSDSLCQQPGEILRQHGFEIGRSSH